MNKALNPPTPELSSNSHLLGAEDSDYMLMRVVGVCRLAMACRFAWYSEHRNGVMVPVAEVGGQFPLEPVADSISGRVFLTGEPVQIRDLSQEAAARASGLSEGQLQGVSYIGHPIFALSGEVIGTLSVMHDRIRTFPALQRQALNDSVRLIEDLLELRNVSTIDPLTGCHNRRHFDEYAQTEWRRASRSPQPLAIAMIDVDYFKAYNDSAGHAQGDTVLRRVGAMLRNRVRRAGDIVCRYGGEEFALVLTSTGLEDAVAFLDQLRGALEAMAIPHPGKNNKPVTVSIGVAAVVTAQDKRETDLSALLERADAALYAAKESGRNQVMAACEEVA